MFTDDLKTDICIISAIYLIIINAIGFASMGIDKGKARRQSWRIPESNLFLVALLGGSIGSLVGMYFFRHKTKHAAFWIGIPLILLLQIALLIWLWFRSPFELLIL